jgi:hypothetical protein
MNIEELFPKQSLKEVKALMDKFKRGEVVKAFKTRRMTKRRQVA